jgi:hypothetical protein
LADHLEREAEHEPGTAAEARLFREAAALLAEIDRLTEVLREIGGETDDGNTGIHFADDGLKPHECPGCIARAALREVPG